MQQEQDKFYQVSDTDLEFWENNTFLTNSQNQQCNIGGLQEMEDKRNEYQNDQVQAHLNELKDRIQYFRQIKQDGNGLFRTISFGYFSQLLQEEQFLPRLKDIIERISTGEIDLMQIKLSEKFQDIAEYYTKEIICQFLLCGFKQLYNQRKQDNVRELLRQYMNDVQGFDFSVIILLRSMALEEFEKNQDIKNYYEKDKIQQERDAIINYGQEPEIMDIMSLALKTRIYTHQIYNNNYYNKVETGNQNYLLSLNLFFKQEGVYEYCEVIDQDKDQFNEHQRLHSEGSTDNQKLGIFLQKQQMKQMHQNFANIQVREKSLSTQNQKLQDENSILQQQNFQKNEQIKTLKKKLSCNSMNLSDVDDAESLSNMDGVVEDNLSDSQRYQFEEMTLLKKENNKLKGIIDSIRNNLQNGQYVQTENILKIINREQEFLILNNNNNNQQQLKQNIGNSLYSKQQVDNDDIDEIYDLKQKNQVLKEQKKKTQYYNKLMGWLLIFVVVTFSLVFGFTLNQAIQNPNSQIFVQQQQNSNNNNKCNNCSLDEFLNIKENVRNGNKLYGYYGVFNENLDQNSFVKLADSMCKNYTSEIFNDIKNNNNNQSDQINNNNIQQ